MQFVDRKGWGARAPDSRTTWATASLEGVCQHWFGSPRAASSHGGCAALLRSVQNTHMAPGGLGTKEGGSDIAYNWAVCPHGTIYQLRGWGVQTGANGTTAANRTHIAFVYMAGEGDPLTEEAKRSLQELYQEAFRRGVGRKAVGHGTFTGSECPGPALRAWINSGAWKAEPAPKDVTSWRVEFGPWGDRRAVNVGGVKSPHVWVKNHPGPFQTRGGPIIFRPRN